MKTFRNFLKEAKPATDNEYYKSINDFYNDEPLLDLIKQGEQQLQHMGVNDIKTEISDNNNVMVKYATLGNNVFVLGISSKKGKLEKGDMPDLKEWMDKLYSAIKSGKIVYSSPNNLSMPLLRKVISKLEKDGIQVETNEMGRLNLDGNEWINLVVRKKPGLNERKKLDISNRYGQPDEEDVMEEIDQKPDSEQFKKYREIILKMFKYDIKDFKLKSKTSVAYQKRVKITDFSIKQIIAGIKVEKEHANDIATRLEITLSHLAEKPKYYTLLIKYVENGPKDARKR